MRVKSCDGVLRHSIAIRGKFYLPRGIVASINQNGELLSALRRREAV